MTKVLKIEITNCTETRTKLFRKHARDFTAAISSHQLYWIPNKIVQKNAANSWDFITASCPATMLLLAVLQDEHPRPTLSAAYSCGLTVNRSCSVGIWTLIKIMQVHETFWFMKYSQPTTISYLFCKLAKHLTFHGFIQLLEHIKDEWALEGKRRIKRNKWNATANNWISEIPIITFSGSLQLSIFRISFCRLTSSRKLLISFESARKSLEIQLLGKYI